MSERLAGIVANSEDVELVVLTRENGEFQFEESAKLKLQKGKRADAYNVIFQQLINRLKENNVGCVCIMGSATNGQGMGKGHLHGAELRGVVMAAAASVCDVEVVDKGLTSKTFGSRKVGEYVKDTSFWDGQGLPEIPKGMREAAFTVIAKFSKE